MGDAASIAANTIHPTAKARVRKLIDQRRWVDAGNLIERHTGVKNGSMQVKIIDAICAEKTDG